MTDTGYITNDNIEATNRAARGISTVGRALGIGVSDAVKNVGRQYDSNVVEANKDIEKPKAPGTDYAERIATKKKDYGTRAAAQGVKGTMGSYKKGGKVKRTGVYKLHAKERVLNAKQTKKFEAKGGLSAVLGGL
jgi:hypothetical protein